MLVVEVMESVCLEDWTIWWCKEQEDEQREWQLDRTSIWWGSSFCWWYSFRSSSCTRIKYHYVLLDQNYRVKGDLKILMMDLLMLRKKFKKINKSVPSSTWSCFIARFAYHKNISRKIQKWGSTWNCAGRFWRSCWSVGWRGSWSRQGVVVSGRT